MAGRDAIIEKVQEITERVAGDAGLEVVDVQMLGGGGSRLLRIFIDKPDGVTHSDCELISQHVGTILDVEDVIPGGGYQLEVSSPGVERKLKTARDFERFQGKKARVQLRKPVENQKRWEGVLAGIASNVISIEPSPGRM